MPKKQKTSRSKLERETIIGWNDEEKTAWVNTTSHSVFKKLSKRLGEAKALSADSWTWDIPREWVKLPNKRRKVNMTEEQKAQLGQNMRKALEARKKQ